MSRGLEAVDATLMVKLQRLLNGELRWPLYLYGPTGTGKTSAALVMLDHCGPYGVKWPTTTVNNVEIRDESRDEFDPVSRNWYAGYANCRDLISYKIKCGESWPGRLRNWTRYPLTVLDEIGIVDTKDSAFKLDTLLEVLNTRCDEPVKPLIVTGNLSPRELGFAYDDRIADRVLCGTPHFLDGPSRRMTRHNGG